MKKHLTLLLAVGFIVVLCKPVLAQDQQNGIYVSYAPGFLSAQGFYESSSDVITAILDDIFTDDEINDNSTQTGIISLGYNRFLSEKIKLGVSGSYAKYTTKRDYTKHGEVVKQIKWSDSFITVMLRFDFHYVRKEKISMYSGISVGASFVKGDNISGDEDLALPSNTLFAFHLNAFGIRFGKDLGFFLESGFGYNGIVSGGVSYQF